MNLKSFYFTFGTDEEFPFRGGWIIIESPNMIAAKNIFKEYFPPRDTGGCLNYSFCYSEEEFKKTIMYKEYDNLGAGCHITIGPR